ncbi:Scr1 family TA system antitoxin-like transcriptional regulator [Spirillospora sp. CA-255316]
MSAADDLDPYASLYAWLAHDLRFYRQKHGLTGTQMGKVIGCVRSHVANLEAGRARIDMTQAKALDELWDTGGHFQRLLWFARAAHDPDWFRQSTEYEAKAKIIRIYQGLVIPIPFQTEDYARAVLSVGRTKDVEEAVQKRMNRQEGILGGEDPPLLLVQLTEEALDRPVGGEIIMRAQLQRLLDLGEQPNVIIRVIAKSEGAHHGMDGPFQIMSLENRDVAYVGAFGGGRLIQDPSEVRDLAVDFEMIGARASSEDTSRALIRKLMKG